MNSISRYPHDLNTKFYAVSLYRNGNPISFVCRRYKCSKASLMRGNKKFDGSKDSLLYKSHRPLTPHPNSHTGEELIWIKNYLRRNPNISLCELYGKAERLHRNNHKRFYSYSPTYITIKNLPNNCNILNFFCIVLNH